LDRELEDIAQLVAHKQFQAAVQGIAALLQRHPASLRAWSSAATMSLQCGDNAGAIRQAARHVQLAPVNPLSHLQLAETLCTLGREAEAMPVLRAVEKLNPGAETLNRVATLYLHCDKISEAHRLLEQCCASAPDKPVYLRNLAMAQRMLGEASEARQNLIEAIDRKPNDYHAYYVMADLQHWSPEENHIEQMEKLLLDSRPDDTGEIYLRYALAKEYDDIGEYGAAFKHLSLASALKRRQFSYSVEQDIATLPLILDAHSKLLARKPGFGHASQDAFFIVGLPRSGTTLAERMLSAHSQVRSAGELKTFAQALTRTIAANKRTDTRDKEALIAASAHIDPAELGAAYMNLTLAKIGSAKEQHFTDKMPLNFLYCGLINSALPNSRIILLQRDPLDSCLAMYRSLFEQAYPFSYTLEEIGHYFVAYRNLVTTWQQRLGDAIHCIEYEALVTDNRHQVEQLLSFCRLNWEDACLDFHKNPSVVSTASASQVRRPIYSTSINRSDHYTQWLTPLIDILDAADLLS
jgi:tetratricopeptide (TPR) repeat protein